jgi:hypothetical protein
MFRSQCAALSQNSCYNFDVLQNGKTYGMLSVNGYSGQVWYHTWHGTFIAASKN